MKIKYQAKGYDLFRTSDHEYTHATIFRNLSYSGEGTNIGAFFHKSERAALAKQKELNRYSHIQFIEIVELEKI